MLYSFAFLIGVSAGMRTMTAPAVACWAARLGALSLQGTPLAFMATPAAAWIWSAAALGELLADKNPKMRSRKEPAPSAARIVMGALCGLALGASGRGLSAGIAAAVVGAAGALAGTFGGYELRVRLARAAGRDIPIALLEDTIAIGLAVLSAWSVGAGGA